MSINLSTLIAQKNRQTAIQHDDLPINQGYIIFSNFVDHLMIKKDLQSSKHINFIGFIVLTEDQDYPKPNFPENDYIQPDSIENLINDGAHLVITSDTFLDLVNLLGTAKIGKLREKIHIAKMTDWLLDRTGKDIYRRKISTWAYDQLVEGNSKEAYEKLKLFLTIYGPRDLNNEDRFTYLADSDICGLANGEIASILNSQADLKNAWIFYKDAVGSIIQRESPPLPHPMWNGQPFRNKRIVFRRELGPADEIAYSNIFNDLIQDDIEVIIETDTRLVNLFERSFPKAEVVPRITPAHPRLLKNDIDYQANYSDPFLQYRSKLNSFPNHNGYIKPDKKLELYWHEYLRVNFSGKLLVGISWGSKSSGKAEDKMKTDIKQWSAILQNPDVSFINLQYGDVGKDLDWVKNKLGVDVNIISELDLFTELDSLAALISNLDLIISVNNINSHLAGAIGTPLWEIVPKFWWLLLGQNYNPFYPQSQIFEPDDNGLKAIADLLSSKI